MRCIKKSALALALAAAVCASLPVQAAFSGNMPAMAMQTANVSKIFPAEMSTGVNAQTPLAVEFSGNIDQSFYQGVTVNLFSETEPVEGELFYNPAAKQVMFKPKNQLNNGGTYTAQLIFPGLHGQSQEKIWSFQIEGNAYNQPAATNMVMQTGNSAHMAMQHNQAAAQMPMQQAPAAPALLITQASMANGAITEGTELSIEFSQSIDINSLKTAPIKLLENNRQVGIDYKVSRDLKTITLAPRNPMSPAAEYTVTLQNTLTSSEGGNLERNTIIPFKIQQTQAAYTAQANPYANPFEHNQAATQNFAGIKQHQTAPVIPNQQARQIAVTGISPQNGVSVSNLTQPVTISFSDEVKPETVNEFTFRLEDDFGAIPAKVHYFQGQKQAVLTPLGVLDPNKVYRVIVTQGITDLYGRPVQSGINSMFSTVSQTTVSNQAYASAAYSNEAEELESLNDDHYNRLIGANSMGQAGMVHPGMPAHMQQNPYAAMQAAGSQFQAAPYQQQFAAAPAANSQAFAANRQAVPPTQQGLQGFSVTKIYPEAEADNVPLRSKIAINFSEPVDSKTADNINISVFANQTRVDGRVTCMPGNKNTVIFTPSRRLADDTEYKVIISKKVKSAMGENLNKGYSWTFNTAPKNRRTYNRQAALANNDFYIPLADTKDKEAAARYNQRIKQETTKNTTSVLEEISSRHWTFRSVRHLVSKNILPSASFLSKDKASRYEFTNAITTALSSLKQMEATGDIPKLKVADLVELQKLVVEFKPELKTFGVNTSWFESFLASQGVNLHQIEANVTKLSKR
ncbi:MAG: Ig-like domain-containing protein [Candidatus Riflebacteria bacterium]|nr:Ig-like domain-containing protein [Candidatus Riflebacteria bacterium]